MVKLFASVAIFSFYFSSVALSAECEFRLDERTFDGAYGWWNRDLQGLGTLVAFDRVNPGLYRVRGVYRQDSEGKYIRFRDYLTEIPTFSGQGETQKIRHIRFEDSERGCRVVLIGDKSHGGQEENIARYSVEVDALAIEYSETTERLRFADLSPEEL